MSKELTEKIVHIQNELDELFEEVKQLQEQLKDAEEALRFYDRKDFHYEVDGVVMGAEPAHKYFVKCGIK